MQLHFPPFSEARACPIFIYFGHLRPYSEKNVGYRPQLPGGRKFCQKAQMWLKINEVAGEIDGGKKWDIILPRVAEK
jgi:hypothetical protein